MQYQFSGVIKALVCHLVVFLFFLWGFYRLCALKMNSVFFKNFFTGKSEVLASTSCESLVSQGRQVKSSGNIAKTKGKTRFSAFVGRGSHARGGVFTLWV